MSHVTYTYHLYYVQLNPNTEMAKYSIHYAPTIALVSDSASLIHYPSPDKTPFGTDESLTMVVTA